MRHQRGRAPSDTRASVRTRLLSRTTSVTIRPLTTVIPLTDRGVRLSRRIVAGSLAAFGPTVPGSSIRTVRESAEDVEIRGEWVRAPGADREDAVILYLHGSAYMLASARTHRGLTSRLSAKTGLPVFACDYRLAPRHRFPLAADDVRAAFRWLLDQGFAADRIVVAGDSAGGHLAVDLSLELCRAGQKGPAALALFSPLIDLTLRQAVRRERQVGRDPMISAARALRLVQLYVRDADPDDPRLAFTLGDADVLPPTFVQAGGAEMLAADAEHLARLIRDAGGRCELEVWPDQMHVFQALPKLVPEAEHAIGQAAAFIRTELETP